MISNTPNQLYPSSYSCNETPAYLHTNEQLVDLKNIGQALERYRSSPNDLQTLDFLKEITFIDEEEHKKLTSSDLNTLPSHCPNLNESYYMPFLEYIQQALTSNKDDFLERAKRVTFISEWDFQSLKKNNISVHSILSICPNLKIYILLERAKNGEVDFQKIKDAGLDDLFSIYPSIMIICEPYQLSVQSLNSMDYFSDLLRSTISRDLTYRTIDGEKEKQLSIIIKSDNGVEEGKRFKLFLSHLLKPQDFSVYSREEFESLIEANRYFQSKDLVEAFTKFLSKPSYSEREKQHLITLIAQIEYGADKNIVGKIIDQLGIQWLQYASELLQDNVEFMQPLIENRGDLAYQHASKRIRNIQDIAYLAIKKSFDSMKYLGDELKNNAEFIESLMKQIKQKGYTIYQYASKTLRSTPNLFYVVMKADEQIAYNALKYIEPCLADDIEFMRPLIEKYGYQAYRHAGKKICNMADIAHLAIKKSFESMKYLGDELKNEQDFVKSLITIDPSYFSHIGKAAQNNLNIAYDLLNHHKTEYSYLQYIGPDIADNLEFIKAAIQKFGHPVIQYASEKIRNMSDLMHIVNESNTALLQYLGNTLKNDPEFIQSCMEKNLFSFKYGSEEVQNNLEIAKFLLQIQDARVEDMLSYIGPDVKDNLEFIEAAIQKLGCSVLRYGSAKVQGIIKARPAVIRDLCRLNEELYESAKVLEFITGFPIADFQKAKEEHRNNLDIANIILTMDEFDCIEALKHIGPNVKDNLEFIQAAIQRFGYSAIEIASERIRNMSDLMHIVNESNTDLLQYLGNTLKNDPEFIQSCMEKNLFSFKYGSEEVQNNLEIAKFLLQIQDARVEDMLSYIGPNVKDNLEFMKAAIERFGYPVLEYASEGIRNTSDLMLPIIKQYPKSIEYLGTALKNDPLFIKSLITINPSYIEYGSDAVRNNFDVAEALIRHTEFTSVHLGQLGPDVRNSEEFTALITNRMRSSDRGLIYIQPKTTSSTEIAFHKKCYSLKATIPQEIEYKNRKYTLIRKKEIPYPWIEKIKLIAITFFSLGLALFSKKIQEDWSMILDRKKIQILYSMKEEKPIGESIS
ncbi:MAG: DUF4116 domain-containing protein [Chlamydia sp.]